MEPSSVSSIFKNLQGYTDLNVTLVPGTSVSVLIDVIASTLNVLKTQVDLVTVTLEPGSPLSILPVNSQFPSAIAIKSTVYYYFIKPSPVAPIPTIPTTPQVPAFVPTQPPLGRIIRPRVPTFLVPPTRPITPPGKGKGLVTPPPTPPPSPPRQIQPLPPTINLNVFHDPIQIGKLQRLVEFQTVVRPFEIQGQKMEERAVLPIDIVVYYHTDQEKALLKQLLGIPAPSEEIGPSVPIPEEIDVGTYTISFAGLQVPLKIWLIQTLGNELADPILTREELASVPRNALKVSLTADNYARELAPLDYSDQSKFYTGLLWLLLNPPTPIISPGSSPETPPLPTYAPSPPLSQDIPFSSPPLTRRF